MSDLHEHIYCAQQINIPPTFPYILKLYAKAAIRTQPYDLLRWTATYFRALANGELPPAKDRLEYPSFIHPSGITPGYLKILLNRFGHVNTICLKVLLQDWRGLDLSETSLYQLLVVAGLSPDEKQCDFYRFLAVACGFFGNVSCERHYEQKKKKKKKKPDALAPRHYDNLHLQLEQLHPVAIIIYVVLRPLQNLLETMIYVCELLTDEPEGGSAMIPLRTFLNLYRYLANLDCSGERHRREVEPVDPFPSSRDTRCVSELSSGTIDSTTSACSCEFATMKKTETSSTDEDVCGEASREKKPLESLEILKDYRDDLEHSDVDIVSARQSVADDKTEIEIESIDRHVPQGGKSEVCHRIREEKPEKRSVTLNFVAGRLRRKIYTAYLSSYLYRYISKVDFDFSAIVASIEDPAISSIIDHIEHYRDTHDSPARRDDDARETADDAFDFNWEDEGGEVVGEMETIDHEITTAAVNSASSQDENCQCLDKSESDQTPPVDLLKEFLKRMQTEVEAGRLETIFRVPGIGPPVSPKRVTAVGLWLADCARRQQGLIGPRNIRHFLCPNLDDISECDCNAIGVIEC
ncbi:uncharacterized protein [Linepithema humile]|uniref:uncharacterized protein n=1 Tax=Linepithema humile TaxID=83485 RepID=UPI00351F7E98